MEFFVEFIVTIPDGTPQLVVEEREAAEAIAAAELVRSGNLVRLWIPPRDPGETKIVGLYRADDPEQMSRLLDPLPLRDWMQITVTPLQAHPNDPGV